ncbi:MAG: 1-acyl-sn-glycerol-3-phosphate acyltransferase [Planctomycetes bacterium]|nr:1-acyl-sn-glycerol-3-phosphate acyltransferase [Planctomycetota bacterium]
MTWRFGPSLPASIRDQYALEPLRIRIARPLTSISLAAIYRVRHRGGEKVPPTGPVIVAANHPCYIDPIFVQMPIARPIRYLAWDLAHDWPFIGRLMTHYQTIPVNPERGERDSIRRTIERLKAGECVGIFAERQRTWGPEIDPFTSGFVRLARWTGAAIVPVTVHGTHRFWPRRWIWPRLRGRVTLIVHDPVRLPAATPVASRQEERAGEERIAREVRETILAGWRECDMGESGGNTRP